MWIFDSGHVFFAGKDLALAGLIIPCSLILLILHTATISFSLVYCIIVDSNQNKTIAINVEWFVLNNSQVIITPNIIMNNLM